MRDNSPGTGQAGGGVHSGRERHVIPQIDFKANDRIRAALSGLGRTEDLRFSPDNRTLAIANRDGLVAIIRLPEGEPGGRHCEIAPLRQIRGSPFCELKSPGSLAVTREANGRLNLLVCNNYVHRVTKHTLGRWSFRAWRNRILLQRGLAIPDGIAVGRNGEWIAVSSHDTHDIKVFRASVSMSLNRAHRNPQ